MAGRENYHDVVSAAVKDLAENGFDNVERVAYWQERIRKAAEESLISTTTLEQNLRDDLYAIYKRLVDRGEIMNRHPGLPRFTIERLAPRLRDELDKRIMASANLIKLNRKEAIEKTVRRFSGWATSVPAGGSESVDKPEEKANLKKALNSLPFEERRVLIDQGHKLTASISNVIATSGGAIAATWNSRFRQVGYDARPEHKHRDVNGQVFVIRGNWAMQNGLMKLGGSIYTDQIEEPAELPFCRCYYTYLYAIKRLPEAMITQKGREEIERVRLFKQEIGV